MSEEWVGLWDVFGCVLIVADERIWTYNEVDLIELDLEGVERKRGFVKYLS